MKPFHFARNFGDAMNAWLWPKLIPGIFEEAEDHLFLGIGSVLNSEWLPATPVKRVVLGSGFAYGTCPRIDEHWKVYCVRGKRTARALGVASSLAVTDPAHLVASTYSRPTGSTHTISFLPHEHSCRDQRSEALVDWRALCARHNLNYIDVLSPVEQVLSEISSSSLVVTEALHGAVVADAFRIPWIPVRCHTHINAFKWEDWCESIEVAYEPHDLPSLGAAISSCRRPRDPPLHAALAVRFVEIVSRCFAPILSAEAVHRRVLDQLHQKVAELERDFFS